jgi:hypothetical protein
MHGDKEWEWTTCDFKAASTLLYQASTASVDLVAGSSVQVPGLNFETVLRTGAGLPHIQSGPSTFFLRASELGPDLLIQSLLDGSMRAPLVRDPGGASARGCGKAPLRRREWASWNRHHVCPPGERIDTYIVLIHTYTYTYTQTQLIATLTSTSPEVAAEIIALGAVSVRDTTSQKIEWRKLCVDAALLPQQQLRIYHSPQRFPAAHVDWSERLLLLEEDYLIVNKPSNLPCMAHPSNAEEHLTACVKR